jgi:hypothetical protein
MRLSVDRSPGSRRIASLLRFTASSAPGVKTSAVSMPMTITSSSPKLPTASA